MQMIFQSRHGLIFPAVYIYGLVQERRNGNSIANALELHLSYTNSLIQYKLCIFIVIKFSISVPRILPTLVMLFTSSGSRFGLKAGRVKPLSYLVAIILCFTYICQVQFSSAKYLWPRRQFDYDHPIHNNHYLDVIITTMASHITSLTVVYSTVYSDANQRKQSSASLSLAFVWGIHRDRWIPRTKGQ